MQQVTVKLYYNYEEPFRQKNRRILTSEVVLMHDNVRPHNADVTKVIYEGFQCNIFDHPAYIPDLASSDFYRFPELKKWLARKSFRTGIEL